MHPKSRREFLETSLAAFFTGMTVLVTGCGASGDKGQTSGGGSGAGDASGAISANHGHLAVVTAAQLNANQSVSLNIRGNASHEHQINLSRAQVDGIKKGNRVSVESSFEDGHTHTVSFNS